MELPCIVRYREGFKYEGLEQDKIRGKKYNNTSWCIQRTLLLAKPFTL